MEKNQLLIPFVDKEILSFNAWDSNAFSATFSSLCQYENMATTCEINKGILPSSDKTAIFVLLLFTPNRYLQNLTCNFSYSQSLNMSYISKSFLRVTARLSEGQLLRRFISPKVR